MNTPSPRNARALREAAVQAGWEGDPLADEILSVLDSADANRQSAIDLELSNRRAKTLIWVACSGWAIAAVAAVLAITSHLGASTAAKKLTEKDAELAKATADFARFEARLAAQQTVLDSTLKAAAASDTNARSLLEINKSLQEDMRALAERQKTLEGMIRDLQPRNDAPLSKPPASTPVSGG